MATGRTSPKFVRVYADGYDLSGHARSIGPLACTYEEGMDDPFNCGVKGAFPGLATVNPGTLNAIFDNTATTGLHALLSAQDDLKNLMVCQGIQAVPAAGDPVFCGQFVQTGYTPVPDGAIVTATIPFASSPSASGGTLGYAAPWGILLNAGTARTAANSSTGIDQGGATAFGGWMMYQVTTAAGTGSITATIKVQHADTNTDGSFADLLSSGVINLGSTGTAVPTSGIVALSRTATVNQFVRWQIVLGTATSVTFHLAFMRGYV